VTLGSSGLVSALDNVVSALGELPVTAWIATANRVELARVPPNVRVAGFLPGNLMARAAAFVITNGGSSTGYQALAEGKPVLGIPSNMDQYLAMSAIERAGAGVLVRGGEATAENLKRAVLRLLESSSFRDSAESLKRTFAQYDCHAALANFLERVFAAGAGGGLTPKEVS
jgi:UDP:flavonoid glycosyltransferase YjiC (YdhE family)